MVDNIILIVNMFQESYVLNYDDIILSELHKSRESISKKIYASNMKLVRKKFQFTKDGVFVI